MQYNSPLGETDDDGDRAIMMMMVMLMMVVVVLLMEGALPYYFTNVKFAVFFLQ